jgi:hypothetical protein
MTWDHDHPSFSDDAIGWHNHDGLAEEDEVSKASEWATRQRAIESTKPEDCQIVGDSGELTLTVEDTKAGVRLYIPSRGWFTPEDAIRAARWILDTFGDEAA